MMDALFGQSAETGGIAVRVSVSYLADQSEPGRGRWFWAYHIRIENGSDRTVQLLTRHWTITDGRGARHTVEGEGVVGEQPVLAPGGSFDYVSGCPLTTPTGAMQGSYHMIDEDGTTFDVAIPKFALLAPAVGGEARS
jgi:ApaG protein